MNQFGGTLNRPQSNAGAGFRPGSQAQGSSYGRQQPQAGVGMSLNQDITVNARPVVMREGMKGMSTSAGPGRTGTAGGVGPGRQVVDRSYYMGLLRPKISQLTAEIERLRHAEQQINNSSDTLGKLQHRQRTLQDEIQQLKGTMADVNFAVEKSSTTNAEEISQNALTLRQQNAEQTRAADKLFKEARDVKNTTKQLEAKLQDDMRNLEQRLRQDGQDFSMYVTTRDEAYRVSDQVMQMQHETHSLIAKQDYLMASLSQDADKKRASNMLLDILKKRQMRDEMKKECSISVEEERELLMQQAKTTTTDIELLTRQVNEAKETIAETKRRISAVKEDLNEYSGDNARKYQELQEKDKEMTQFMESFTENERVELQKIADVEKNIVEQLERLSRVQVFKDNMPKENAPGLLNTLADEIQDKEEQVRNAQLTHQRLEKELGERREELTKIETLDSNIQSELQTISQRVQEQKGDIIRYSDIEGMKTQVAARKKSLEQRRHMLLKQRENSKQHINVITNDFEASKARLQTHDAHQAIAAHEQKLRLIWQSAFSLEEFVRMKEKDTQYMNTKAECIRIVDECNSMHRDQKRFETEPQGVMFT